MRYRVGGEVIMGLDLSLTGSAACVLGAGWRPEDPWRGIVLHRFGEEGKLEGQARQTAIVLGVWRIAVREGVSKAAVEEHAFSKGLMQRAFARAELVGAVKESLASIPLATVPIVASGARKLLFGAQHRMSTKEWKAFIGARFGEMGAPGMTEDERDAIVIANAMRYRLGLPFLGVP